MASVLSCEMEEVFSRNRDLPHLLYTLLLMTETLVRMHLKLERYSEYLITDIII